MILRSVSGDGVEQDVPHMELVGIQRKIPDGYIVLDQEGDVADDAGGNGIREEVPHLAGIASVTRYGSPLPPCPAMVTVICVSQPTMARRGVSILSTRISGYVS